jgi:hypothetical protein
MFGVVLTVFVLALAVQTPEASLRRQAEATSPARQVSGPWGNTARDLNGKALVIRMYRDARKAPSDFELQSVPFEGNQVIIKAGQARSAAVIITGMDQKDKTVSDAVGGQIFAQALTGDLKLSFPMPQGVGQEEPFWQLTDALAEPLAGAVAEVWFMDRLTDRQDWRIRFGQTRLDSTGRVFLPGPRGNLSGISFTVSDPNYGCAQTDTVFASDHRLALPLVRKGTVAADRAIRGRVVDPNGMPVGGATIRCWNIRTLGEGLISGGDGRTVGVTDVNGEFSYYMPNRKARDDRGELIPSRSRYEVRIEAPKSLGLLSYTDPIENGQDTLVSLESGGRLRRFRFEDPNGEITDPVRLEYIQVSLQRPGHTVLVLLHEDWKDGARLPSGSCEAYLYGPQGGEVKFQSVQLAQQSPDVVVFRLPASTTYFGRVVQGITGQPMTGAFALAMNATCEERLCDLGAGQWDALHRLPSNPLPNDAALNPLRKVYGFTRLVRTDAAGNYRIALAPTESLYGVVVFEQDYVAVMHPKHTLTLNADHSAEVPTIRLFPAATVLIQVAVDKEHASIMPKWEIDEQSRPAWVADLFGRDSRLEYQAWMKPNTRLPVQVPANVSLRLGLSTPYDEEFCPILIPQVIRLAQGETLDLGSVRFERAISIQVKVVNAAGRPLEGIPVRMATQTDGMMCWSLPHNTDDQGIARFYGVPNTPSLLGVLYHGDNGKNLQETVECRLTGPQDTRREFVLKLSDEMLGRLLR